jgi:D-sedoheptulose 7-phosphate isomerase
MKSNFMRKRIEEHIQRSLDAKSQILNDEVFLTQVEAAAKLCANALKAGKKILFAGNGGSASDAQHLAAELVGRYKFDRAPLASIALTTDTSALTAIGNDYGFKDIFSRQVNALANEGDVFVGISTSGNSENIMEACQAAKDKKCHIIGMSGAKGKLKDLADIALAVQAPETATIQEVHIMLGHILCDGIEQVLFSTK